MYREEEIATTQVAGDEKIPDVSISGQLLCRTERTMQITITFMNSAVNPERLVWSLEQSLASCDDEYYSDGAIFFFSLPNFVQNKQTIK